jgi:hypothetical protein
MTKTRIEAFGTAKPIPSFFSAWVRLGDDRLRRGVDQVVEEGAIA